MPRPKATAMSTLDIPQVENPQLELFQSGESEAQEEKYKSTPGAFFNGKIWTVPEDVPF